MNNFHMREGKVEFRWKRWRNKKRQEVSSCLMVLFSGAVLLGAGGVALAGPTGGQVTGGQGTITTPDGTTTNINQQSNVLNINWQDFSIGAGETVNFYQPGSTSVAINRVVGGVPSYLAGALNANGRVFILNSAGITFTGTSQVNVGALLATTAMTVNGDPTQAASYSGSGYGAVINQGSISVSNGGFAILAAPYVQNTGFIKADLGTIALAGTNQFTLDLSGTGLINFVVPAGAVEKIVSDGKAVGVDNSGTLQARSGQVLISASVASEVINAVVNLNGIVDADAFAPNGQGGSVLVTAAGDVNVGGQVTARGDGTGNGGQIVTKAGGADAIGALAYVSAAGGASGGKGGFIEVSGKQVGLAGAIDPGSGGSMFIDPTNIIVIAGTNGGLVGSHIGSDFIENQLQHNINVTLQAAINVEFQALADDHQLVGGNGNFTVTAGTGEAGNIIFLGTNDAIVQGAGFIHMNANGGDIGASDGIGGHAINLRTGVNAGLPFTTAGVGVTQAGDIVLKAGHDIDVKNVTVKSSGGSSFTAKFSASAGHNFIASGDINVLANAHGPGSQTAFATVDIFAHNNIRVQNVTVQALANVSAGSPGFDAHASANLQLQANGSINAAGAILDRALASDGADGDAHANALANIQANGSITVHNVDVKGTANQYDSDGSSAIACANLNMFANSSLSVIGHVGVFANARAAGTSFASANAEAELLARRDITVNGSINVSANANQTGTSGSGAFACAGLDMDAGDAGSSDGNINVNGPISVTAAARTRGTGTASANANAEIAAAEGDSASGDVNVNGNISVNALADQLGSSGNQVHACANLDIDAQSGIINVNGSIGVAANALSEAGDSSVTANAKAEIGGTGSSSGVDITVNGNIDVSATANHAGTGTGAAQACANLDLDASSGGDVNVNGNIGVHANAQSRGSTGSAWAQANAEVAAEGGASGESGQTVNVNGSIDVTAVANQLANDAGGGAYATANLDVDASSGVDFPGHINVNGDITVAADARSNGTGAVRAIALAEIGASDSSTAVDVRVGGNIAVTATANHAGTGSGGVTAWANLDIDASSGSVDIGGNVTVTANAQTNGSGGIVFNAFGTDSTNFYGAAANAQAEIAAESGSSPHPTKRTGPGNVTVDGDVEVSAIANVLGTGEAGAALACANLDMDATFSFDGAHGNVNVFGNIGVNALATNLGDGDARANAVAGIDAEGSVLVHGNINVDATANQLNGSSGEEARACANLQINAGGSDGSGSVNVNGDITVSAKALGSGTQSAHANAKLNIFGCDGINITGNVAALASANQNGSDGSTARANANLQLVAGSNSHAADVNVNGDVTGSAKAVSRGSESAVANTFVNIHANDGDVIVNGVVTANARAVASSSSTGTGALANASMSIVGDPVTLGGIVDHATANSHGNGFANAVANVNVIAADVEIDGDVSVVARALTDNFFNPAVGAQANAQVLIQASGTGSSDQLKITGRVNVLASASDFSTVTSHANALANVVLTAAGRDTQAVDLGDVRVTAIAFDWNGHTETLANAQLRISASNGETGGVHMGSLDVKASAHEVFGSPNVHANALANALINAHNTASATGNDVLVVANAFDGASAVANANLTVNGSHVVLGNDNPPFDSDTTFGPIGARALAIAGDATGEAHANANVHITANSGNASIFGTLEAIATASYDHSGGNAANNITADAVVHVNALAIDANIVVESISVTANAQNWGNKSAQAHASLNLNADNTIFLDDPIVVAATADNHNSHANNASALASAKFNAVGVVGTADSSSVAVRAHAINAGHNQGKALALLDFGSATFVEVGGITLDVLSSDVGANGTGAVASAVLLQTNSSVYWRIGDHGINVQAVANSHGVNGANALASVDIEQANIIIEGPVTVNAEAFAGSNAANGAQAVANLLLLGSAIAVGEDFDDIYGVNSFNFAGSAFGNVLEAFGDSGAISVTANAHDLGGNHANAQAKFGAFGDFIYTENVTVDANAFDANGHVNTFANADLFMVAEFITVGSMAVVATADQANGTAAAVAHAHANAFIGADILFAEGGIAVLANAKDPHGFAASATAELNLIASNVFMGNLLSLIDNSSGIGGNMIFHAPSSAGGNELIVSANNYSILVAATAVYNGSNAAGHAQADANATINTGKFETFGAVDVLAFAADRGGNSANADADLTLLANAGNASIAKFGPVGSLTIAVPDGSGNQASVSFHEGVFVGAVARDSGEAGHARADAYASVQACDNVEVIGGVDVLALADDSFGNSANAGARLLITAGLNVELGFGSVSLNGDPSDVIFGNLADFIGQDSIGVLVGAKAVDSGAGASHHANALASANIDPNLVQINGDVIVAAVAFDNSGMGATANANLFIHANEVHIGTSGGDAQIIVAASAQDSGLIPAAVNAQANANILANGTSTDAISINDVTVFAFANAEAVGGGSTVIANAHLFMSANNGGVRMGSINVAAVAIAEDTNSRDAQANASANVHANKQIFVNGDISVTASASDTATNAGDANAFALLVLNAPNSSIDVEGTIFVGANAYENGGASAIANATASIQAERVTLNGGVDIEAQANLANAAGTSAHACANLDIDASSGSVNINGPVTVNAQASGNGTGNASAYALAEIEANSGDVTVTGNIDVTANALLDGHQGDGAHANANLYIDAFGSSREDINLTGNITVNAQAQGNGTHGGGSGDSVTANAQARIGGTNSSSSVDVSINGNVEVTANAFYSGDDGQNAWACANLQINATSGSVNIHGNVTVNAVALSFGTESAYANAKAEISAENNIGSSSAGNIVVVGNISVLANAELDNTDGWGAHACANLNIIAHSGDVILTGNLRSNAHALGNGDNSTESVTANARMQLETNSGNVSVTGFVTVDALASYTGDDHENARACASLDVDASSGDLTINGAVNVVASAVADGTGTASANANAELAAESGGPASSAGNVTILGDINVKANAQELNSSGGTARACASLDIDADSGNIFIGGGIRMNASAHDEGSGNASAIANVDLDAEHNITVIGDIGAFANATHLGSSSGNASAVASVSVNAGNNVSLRGLVAIGDADVPDTSASHSANAIATANIGVRAGSNISIGPDGLFADADASAFSAGHASANAQIAVDAGTNGVGNLFIRGNVIAIAVALGSATGNTAHANAHMAAGGATEFGFGPPSDFGNITVIGNIGAFAAADATADNATASVEIFAQNNLLIVGNDPIASAVVGAGGGTVFAFRQAHVTTNQFASGPGGDATADIDIRAGGFVAVFPASSLTHLEKLYAMPTDTPTLNSSGGLTIIPLTIEGQDCGVFGSAGQDQNAINKALSCHRKPINVSDLTDTGP